MDGWMLVSQWERRGEEIDSADERRGWVGTVGWRSSHGEEGREEGTGVLSGGHSLQCVHPLHSPSPSLADGLSERRY